MSLFRSPSQAHSSEAHRLPSNAQTDNAQAGQAEAQLASKRKRPRQKAPHLPSDEALANFEMDLKTTADEFLILRDRFFAIRRAKAKYEQAVLADLSQLPSEELEQMRDRIEALQLTLESQLVPWKETLDPLWQILRLGGSGLVIGWLLHS